MPTSLTMRRPSSSTPAVVLPRFAVNARRGRSRHREIGRAQALHLIHVVEERREPLFPVLLSCLTYTLERAGRAAAGPVADPTSRARPSSPCISDFAMRPWCAPGKHGTSRFPGELRPHVFGVSDRAGFDTVLRERRVRCGFSAYFHSVRTLKVKRTPATTQQKQKGRHP